MVVLIWLCPKRVCNCSTGMPLSIAFVASGSTEFMWMHLINTYNGEFQYNNRKITHILCHDDYM